MPLSELLPAHPPPLNKTSPGTVPKAGAALARAPAPAPPPAARARPLGRRRAGAGAHPRGPGAILDSVTGPRLAEGVRGGDEEAPRRRTRTARNGEGKLFPRPAGAVKVEPRRRPPREQRLGCGRSVGGRGGGSAERGPREASCESGGSRRLRPRSPGCCVGEAAPGSRYGGGSGPRPAVGRAGSSAAAGGARGPAGRDRDLGTCQQGAVHAHAGACGRAGWLAPPGSPSAERVRALGKPGAGKAGGLGRVPRSIRESQAREAAAPTLGGQVENLANYGAASSGELQTGSRRQWGLCISEPRGESRRRFVANGVCASGPGGFLT